MQHKKLVFKISSFCIAAILQINVNLAASENQTPANCSNTKQKQESELSSSQWGVQAAITDGGSTSIGLVNYGEHHSAGITIAAYVVRGGKNSNVISNSAFGGPRIKVRENTYFAFGIDFGTRFGKQDGNTIKSSFFIGPYVSIEYQPLRHIVLTAWINPYTYQSERLETQQRVTKHKFGAGGIGMSYLF